MRNAVPPALPHTAAEPHAQIGAVVAGMKQTTPKRELPTTLVFLCITSEPPKKAKQVWQCLGKLSRASRSKHLDTPCIHQVTANSPMLQLRSIVPHLASVREGNLCACPSNQHTAASRFSCEMGLRPDLKPKGSSASSSRF